MAEGMGFRGGAVEQNCGPHLTLTLLTQRSVRCTVYRFPRAPPSAPTPHRARYGVPPTRTPTGPPSHFPPSTASSPSAPAYG
jgi:hypothetical protein